MLKQHAVYWTAFQKYTFRLLALYAFFYMMSNQFVLSFAFESMWQQIVPWFAEHLLGLPQKITVFTNGSGDTTYNYVSLLCYLIIAAIITIIWSIADRKRPNYNKLLHWFIVLVRYYIIFQMVTYGLAKLFYLQFQPPSFTRLIQAYGDSSPMGILWTFMGYSKGYTMFTGAGELLGGLLLLFRRTRTLGAIIVFAVMANVMALNFFYDVPVKLLSTHIVLLSVFLIALDAKRMWNVFIANQPTKAQDIPPTFINSKLERIKNIVKWVIIVGALGFAFYSMTNLLKQWGPEANKALLHGLYEIENLEKNGKNIPPLATDSTRWKRIVVDRKGQATIQTMTEENTRYTFQPDTTEQFIIYHLPNDTLNIDTLYYTWIDSTHLQFEGMYLDDTLKITTRRRGKEDFLLMNRGFRWINEYPFNR